MRTESAKRQLHETRQVVQLVYPGVTLLDVSGPSQVFGNAGGISPNGELEAGPIRYKITIASEHGGSVETDTGIALATTKIGEIDTSRIDTFLVSGGIGVLEGIKRTNLVDWVEHAAVTARRYGSTCMGAFLLAEAGLSKNRRVTTHWRWAGELAKRYPELHVEAENIYIKDHNTWSSAGVTSGIDMSLAMVEEDIGHKTSFELAKALLVDFRRPGNQMQYSSRLRLQMVDEQHTFDALHSWMSENLQANLSSEVLSDWQGMSLRNFARVYKSVCGTTPAKSVERLRVEAAKNMLARERKSVASVARAVGFGCEKTMRRSFVRTIGVTPIEFRSRYAKSEAIAE